jgi:hypothetical protein
MPRGRLNEKHVQRAAIKWLATHHHSTLSAEAVVAEPEVVVSRKTKLGSGRADGLIAAQLLDGSIYTAAVEAKSARTIFNISLWYRDEKWILHALLVGGFGLVVTGIIGWLIGTWFWMWLFPILTFFIVGFAHLLFTFEHHRYQSIDVITQVKRYPANEQWIALSADAYNLLGNDLQQALRNSCRREGIGFLRIRSTTNLTLLESARRKNLPKGYADFLACYARAASIRQKLQAQAR